MNNVKNNHDAPLAVAGVTIKAGATVGIEPVALRAAMSSNAVRQWIKLGLLEVEGLDELVEDAGAPDAPTPPSDVKGDEKTPERLALEARAAELGLKGNVSNMKNETLSKKVEEAEDALTKPE